MDGLSLDVRLEANAILDRLLDNDAPTFDPAEAQRLIALIPCEKKRGWLSISGVIGRTCPGLQAQAAGVGQTELPREREIKEFDFSGRVLWRVGRYKLVHEPGEITITLMLDVNPLEQEECYLVYDPPNTPEALFVASPQDYQISLFGAKIGVRVMRRNLWKKPSA